MTLTVISRCIVSCLLTTHIVPLPTFAGVSIGFYSTNHRAIAYYSDALPLQNFGDYAQAIKLLSFCLCAMPQSSPGLPAIGSMHWMYSLLTIPGDLEHLSRQKVRPTPATPQTKGSSSLYRGRGAPWALF